MGKISDGIHQEPFYLTIKIKITYKSLLTKLVNNLQL